MIPVLRGYFEYNLFTLRNDFRLEVSYLLLDLRFLKLTININIIIATILNIYNLILVI